MTANPIRRIWAEGGCVLNAFLSLPSPFAAEVMAAQGHDSLTVDLQHGLVDYATMVGMFQAMQGRPVAPMARVEGLLPAQVMKVLDAGALGVICPLVNTPGQAADFVAATRYPPHGNRSFGPVRAVFSAGADYADHAGREIVTFAMIETAEAMRNLSAIAATPGLDALYIGPADLTLGLTQGRLPPGFDREEPEMLDAISRILAAAHGAGIRAGIHCGTAAYAARMRDLGFDLVTVANDLRLMAGAAAASVAAFRATAARDARGY